MTFNWIVIIAGAVLYGLYFLGRMTPESKMRRPIIDTVAVPEPIKILIFIVIICAVVIWLLGGR
jgi:hypothetical protein